ncbi:hypothetical protein [Listeria booriae]|uniref:hypothetical protein n=1 Tax=Listeria booriae TaxID=1552123 RepID=UPI0016280CDC|nr:hypothetical protein [Listeria booriae]MBC2171079.1 hypothetical protein [Listeria booriae]
MVKTWKITALLFLCMISFWGSNNFVLAQENTYLDSNETYTRENEDIATIYKQAIDAKILTKERYTYSSWIALEKSFLWPNYTQVKKEGLIDQTTTYKAWLQNNNYGAIADFDNGNFKMLLQGSATAANKSKFVNTIQKGDFVVVSDVREPWAPFIGHAAIATTDNWILDMPGYKDGTYTKEDNNRQLKKGDWFNKYQNAWTTVYRVKTSKQVRNNIADWADWRYWSSNHGLTKNRHVKYDMKTVLKGSYDKAYCSKLVWQALYYGSGDLPLVIARPTTFTVAPYFLPGEMNTAYTPTRYGPF